MRTVFRLPPAPLLGAAAILLAAPAAVGAQDLQTLTITRFSLARGPQDVSPARMDGLVHLVVAVHIRERVDRLDNLVLPDLQGFQTEGDEHTISSGPAGTDYQETVTMSPRRPGRFSIGPATIDAVNRQDGTPSRFSSNVIAVEVAAPGRDGAAEGTRTALLVLLAAIAAAFVFFFGRLALTTLAARMARPAPRPATQVPPIQAAAPAPAAPGRLARLAQAMEQARRRPGRAGALELRLALRDALGAHPDETLSDILVRVPDGERGIYARALRAAERAAFIDDDARTTALEDGLVLIEAARARLERDL